MRELSSQSIRVQIRPGLSHLPIPDRPVSPFFLYVLSGNLFLASYGETGGFAAGKTGLSGAVWINDLRIPWCAEHRMLKRQKTPVFRESEK